jgi:hypothetical protein
MPTLQVYRMYSNDFKQCHETFPSFNHNLLHFTSLLLIYHFPNTFLKVICVTGEIPENTNDRLDREAWRSEDRKL